MTATVTALASAAPTTKSAARRTQTLPTPAQLRERLPLSDAQAEAIDAHRQAVRDILDGKDDRLLVITGPCSLHDPDAALEYAERLAELQSRVADRLLLVMRAYVEKPRTTVGWKGMLYDPQLDGSGDMAAGLALSRRTMLAISELGLPIATELLQPLAASYLDDLLSWGCIGARTSESQIHREMVSGLHLPVGFKNGTDGGMTVACDAMRSAQHPHQHFGMDMHGRPALVETVGNPDTHIVLRGGHSGPNYQAEAVAKAARKAEVEPLAAAKAGSAGVDFVRLLRLRHHPPTRAAAQSAAAASAGAAAAAAVANAKQLLAASAAEAEAEAEAQAAATASAALTNARRLLAASATED